MAHFHGEGNELQLTFNIPFMFARFTAEALSSVVAQTLAELPKGESPVWAASNHDVSRFPSRWCDGDERKARLALLVLATLPGTLVLYDGDEIAMTDVQVGEALRRDPMTPKGLLGEGRDRARTPMHGTAPHRAASPPRASARGSRPATPSATWPTNSTIRAPRCGSAGT